MRHLATIFVLFTALAGNAGAQDVFSGLISPGPLSSAHGHLEGTGNCTQCHQLAAGVPNTKCLDCHAPIAQRIDQKRGIHGQLGDARCIDCHGEHKGRRFDLRNFDPTAFDHSTIGWPLRGAHAEAACRDCHGPTRSFLGAQKQCESCHQDPHKGQFTGQTCDQCHGEEFKTFKLPDFDHSKTRFPLVGQHAKQPCASCHADGNFKPLDFADCASCHQDPHKGQFQGQKCQSCHSAPTDWKAAGAAVNHDKTRFPLKGAHTQARCEDCHAGGRFQFDSLECKTCHQDPHKGQFKNQDCASCHTVQGFKPAVFDHAKARFSLTGLHKQLACQQCHTQGKFKPLKFEDCDSCHKDPHRKQFEPKPCSSCHNTQGWKKGAAAAVDHDKTRFPLKGQHQDVRCESCHKAGQFQFPSLECKTCHQDPHRGQFQGQDCASCHTEQGFQSTTFQHARASFQLLGKHKELRCYQCHEGGKFKPIAHQQCIDCHKVDPHKGQFGGQDCGTCHVPEGWEKSTFDHGKNTSFPLVGQHAEVACRSCHQGEGPFKALPTQCASCHQDVHKDPLRTACQDCHTPTDWSDTHFAHDLPTFRLLGQHANVPCQDCHKQGTQPPVPAISPECIACHRDEHAGQLGQRCQDCHQPVSWNQTTFRHIDISDRLTGVHATLQCIDCHKDNRFKGVDTQCIGCHREDFLSVTTPNHQQSGFTQCAECHSQNAWRPAAFEHERFFRLDGAHRTATCEDCHRNGVFQGTPRQCIGCHQADYAGTRNPNHQQAGIGQNCQDCHTTAAWQPASINHDNFFRLDGAHRGIQCEDCHRNGVFQGTPRQCIGCHQADYNGTRNPNHQQAGLPQTCQDCHSTAAWQPADFDHAQFFPVPHEGVNQCQDCHTTGNSSQFSCIDCHEHNREEMNDKHDDVGGYQFNSLACLNCHPRGREDD